jgi:hypothetical protein
VPTPIDRRRVLAAGRSFARALGAGGAAAARELAAERERRRAAELAAAEPPSRRVRVGGRFVYGLLLAAVACLLVVALNIDLLLPAGARPYFRAVCGGLLVLAGLPLAGPRTWGRSLVVGHLLRSRSRGWRFRVLDPLLQAAGVLMLGGAAFELARAIPKLV